MKQRAAEAVVLVVVGLVTAARLCTAEITYIPTEDGFTLSFQGEVVRESWRRACHDDLGGEGKSKWRPCIVIYDPAQVGFIASLLASSGGSRLVIINSSTEREAGMGRNRLLVGVGTLN